MAAFGATVHVGKLEFDTSIEMLGIIVDSGLRRFSIPARRWMRLRSLLEQLLAKERVPLRLLAKAAGSLVSMADGLRHAKTMMWSVTHTIQSYLSARPGSWHQHIPVPEAVKASCTMWLTNFHRFNGIDLDRPPDRVMVWDACKYGSGGAALTMEGDPIALAHLDTPVDERAAHNNVKELGAAVDVSIPLLGHFAHRRVILKGDNTTALSYIRRGGGKSRLCTAIAQGLLSLFIAFDVDIVSVLHIPGPQNVLSDRLSRHRDHRGDWAIKASALQVVRQWVTQNQFPMFNVDAFASHLNHICPIFCSRWHELDATFVDFFLNDFADPDLVLWCNPPFSLLMRVLGHLQHLPCPVYTWWRQTGSSGIGGYPCNNGRRASCACHQRHSQASCRGTSGATGHLHMRFTCTTWGCFSTTPPLRPDIPQSDAGVLRQLRAALPHVYDVAAGQQLSNCTGVAHTRLAD